MLSKNQLKKQAKLEAKQHKQTNVVVAPTAEEDYQHRVQYAEEQRKKFATLYQPPVKGVHTKWTGLMRKHFSLDNKEHLMQSDKKYTSNLVTVIGHVSSCRSAGKLGFLTLYFPPEEVYDTAVMNQMGVILRPEIQILIRAPEFQVAKISQKYVDDDLFVGLPIPKYHIEIEETENVTEYIKQLTRKDIRVFDQIYVIGYPGYSNTGERTIYAKHIFPASINHYMPVKLHGTEEHNVQLSDKTEEMYRNPFMRWMYNTHSLHTQLVRSKFQNVLRNLLADGYNLMEVDVPHLLTVASGANAKPFKTHQEDGNVDYMMRIAPELELKMATGLSTYGVFNIGSQFRNEGQDTTHNPEFRSCEFYMRMKSFYELLQISEKIITSCCIETLKATNPIMMEDYVNGNIKKSPLTYSTVFVKENGDGYCIQWDKPFLNINFIDGINKNLMDGFKLPDPRTFDTDEALENVRQIAKTHGVAFKDTDSISKILDNMFDDLVLVNTYRSDLPNSYFKERDEAGNLIITPVTVFGHPKIMSPLAMEIPESGLVYRFESFVAGMEICNAYQELSDPKVQKDNFDMQQKFQEKGDSEAMNGNSTFMKFLEIGMSPVAGWGMGLERMYMLLTNNYSIRSVLPFPQMKPE